MLTKHILYLQCLANELVVNYNTVYCLFHAILNSCEIQVFSKFLLCAIIILCGLWSQTFIIQTFMARRLPLFF